ncbi:MAG: hypothetical protein EOO42_16215 [Flavobacteriales bacterium]|nr:MAG: hypothetical protein EOO42_16215 [Flavobacteriales bacterium]
MQTCKKDVVVPIDNTKITQDVLSKLKAAGFDTSEGLKKTEGGYMVEYDIFMSDSLINNLSSNFKVKIPLSATNLKGKVQSKDVNSHYTSNHLLITNANSQRNITVFMDPSFGSFLQNALDQALQRYNDLGLSITFSRTTNSSNAGIRISAVNNESYLMSAGFPYGNGDNYDKILVNVDYYNSSSNRADAISTFAHEIGHCIGFRHNDFMNRSFSCGVGGSENYGSTGANYVPGTTSGPSAGSWMLACSNNLDRPFTLDDIVALRIVYPLRRPVYVKEVMNFISEESWAGGTSDWSRIEWDVTAEFYSDYNRTIPYTTEDNFILNVNQGSDAYLNETKILIPNGVTSFHLGTFVRDHYYSYGTLTQDNSSGYRVVGWAGYWGPNYSY